jgi:HSP20 family protein
VRSSRRSDPFAELYGEFADRLRGDHWQPDVDIYETEDAILVRAELAGVRREDLRVTVDGDVLHISGIRVSRDSSAVRLHQMEIASGPFARRVRVPVDFERGKVAAHLADGVLTVTLEKRKPVRRTVKVERE